MEALYTCRGLYLTCFTCCLMTNGGNLQCMPIALCLTPTLEQWTQSCKSCMLKLFIPFCNSKPTCLLICLYFSKHKLKCLWRCSCLLKISLNTYPVIHEFLNIQLSEDLSSPTTSELQGQLLASNFVLNAFLNEFYNIDSIYKSYNQPYN